MTYSTVGVEVKIGDGLWFVLMRRLFMYPGPLWRLTAIVAWFVAATLVLVFAPILMLLILFRFPISWQTTCVQLWFKGVSAASFIKFNVERHGDYDPNKPCLIVSNHQSLMDIPAAYAAFSGNIRMVAKQELFWIPLFGQAMKAGGFIPISRGNRQSSAKVMRLIRDRLSRGIQIWVAPEGTRSKDGRLGEYKWGSFGLAIEAEIPIQPIVVLNSCEALPRSSFLPRPGTTIRVVTLPQIVTRGLSVQEKSKVAKTVRELSAAVLLQS